MIVEAKGAMREKALAFLAEKLEIAGDAVCSDDRYSVFLSVKEQRALGAVLFKNYASGDIEMVCAGEPGWCSPDVVRFTLSYPFHALGCRRITCVAAKRNKRSRRFLLRLGFKLEGTKRKALEGADLMIYGLLKEESRWA